jgi:hypothetical protein
MKENKALSSTLQKARGGKDAASKNSIVLLEAERSKREETEKTAQQLRSQNSEQMIKISELQAQLEAARNEAADAARESMDKTHLLQGALAEAQDFQKLSDKLTVQLNDALLSVQHLEAALDSSLNDAHQKEEDLSRRIADLAHENEDLACQIEGLKAGAQARSRELEQALRNIHTVQGERDLEASRADREAHRARAKEVELADLEKRLATLRSEHNEFVRKLSAAVADEIRAKTVCDRLRAQLIDAEKKVRDSEAQQQQNVSSLLQKLVDACQAGEIMHAAVCNPFSGSSQLGLVLDVDSSFEGVCIKEILEGKPAADSRLHVGDLIVAIDGIEVKSVVHKNLLSNSDRQGFVMEEAER